jgi:hypothetical protein
MIPTQVAAFAVMGVVLLLVANFPPQRKSWVREWAFPLLGLIGWLALLVAFAVSGAAATVGLAVAAKFRAGLIAYEAIGGVGAVAGMWAATITTQLIANLARIILGQRPRPIEWVKHWPRKSRKRAHP